ncbi:MAG: SPOR domain-containing protein [Methylococcaceae bacterium]
MASQNYRNNNKNRKRSTQSSSGAFQWMLITGLLIGLVVFGVYLKSNGLKKLQKHLPQNSITAPLAQIISSKPISAVQPSLSPEAVENLEHPPEALPTEVQNELANEAPQFEFYTMLSEKEVLVPEYEIVSRTQQEKVSTPVAIATSPIVDATPLDIPSETSTKSNATYMMQAGSFKNSVDAEKMRANLEAMGIEARVEKGKVGETIYHRIKLGPYTQMTSVSTIRARLKQSGIDVIVTESTTH